MTELETTARRFIGGPLDGESRAVKDNPQVVVYPHFLAFTDDSVETPPLVWEQYRFDPTREAYLYVGAFERATDGL